MGRETMAGDSEGGNGSGSSGSGGSDNGLVEAYLLSRITGYNPYGVPLFGSSPNDSSNAASPNIATGGFYPGAVGASGAEQATAQETPKSPLTAAQVLRRRIAVGVGMGIFAAVLATDNNNLLRLFEDAPLVKQSVRQVTKPGVARLGQAKDISFADGDYPYVVANKEACLYELPNAKKKTDICFDKGHKIFGQVVQPQGESGTQKPVWLAVQVRLPYDNSTGFKVENSQTIVDGKRIVGNAYMALRDLKAEPLPEPRVPAATAADYEVFLQKKPAKPAPGKGAASAPRQTPGG